MTSEQCRLACRGCSINPTACDSFPYEVALEQELHEPEVLEIWRRRGYIPADGKFEVLNRGISWV